MAKEVEADTKGITVKKFDDMPEWYGQVVTKAQLADYSPVKGCMVIRPKGYALWQAIMDRFNQMLAEDGVENAYFPLFIPESFFKKEAEHAEGFTPEVAWIEKKEESGERLAIRPTSETIMYDSYSRWIRSWRDLPLKINQWCNIVRWEVQDVKLFLRSREFLWQEGHCVYETHEEANTETLHYLERYRQIAEEYLAVPTLFGKKTEREKFAGALVTYGIEGIMPDGKALQMGTSHDLGQNFANAFNITFQGRDEERQLPWQNSWGISTRMIGALVMTHADDKGLVLPPRVARNKLVIIPIIFKGKEHVHEEAKKLAHELAAFAPILDDREEYSAGWKYNKYELDGTPLRVEIGPRDIENHQVIVVRRDTGEKLTLKREGLAPAVAALLETIQADMFAKAKREMLARIVEVEDYAAFTRAIEEKQAILCGHCGGTDCENEIRSELAAKTRIIPFGDAGKPKPGEACIKCGEPAKYRVYFARAY